MQAVYGDQCVDVSTVRRWVRRFKEGELGQADYVTYHTNAMLILDNLAVAHVVN